MYTYSFIFDGEPNFGKDDISSFVAAIYSVETNVYLENIKFIMVKI